MTVEEHLVRHGRTRPSYLHAWADPATNKAFIETGNRANDEWRRRESEMMFTAASDPSRRSSNGRGHMTTAARIFCEPTNLALVNGRRRHRAATVRRRILAVMRKVVLQNEGRPIDDRSIDHQLYSFKASPAAGTTRTRTHTT
jgi:hypothetical protein